jgi:hypothetical protein
METFLSAACLFLIGTLIHILWWRIRLPSSQTSALLKIYSTTFLAWIALWATGKNFFWITSRSNLVECSLLYGSVVLAYIVTYSAIEAESPTLTIMMMVHEGPACGIRIDQIYAYVDRHPFLRSRLEGLVASGTVVIENDKIKAGRPPSLPIRLVIEYRNLFGHLESIG